MNRKFSGVGIYLIIILMVIWGFRLFNPPTSVIEEKNVTEFITELKNKNVKSINYEGSVATFETKDNKIFKTIVPNEERELISKNYIFPNIESDGLKVTGTAEKNTPVYIQWIPDILMIVIFGGFIYFLMSSQGGGSKMNNFGKNRAKVIKPDDKGLVSFNEVASLEEEKEELSEIVDFLKNPKKFIDMGARIPKGVLMVGPPGTGKTYLSRAVAGEAKVPFFSISGSDFVEMFVGIGASRVRDLFDSAKKNAPCIVFIDEIDAVGRRRGAGVGGGHDEREQTLNQLLVEMDGFTNNEGVIVIAATNRADILDPALLRPGRFDRTIYVGLPDVKGREEILRIHSRKKVLDSDIDLKTIAKMTPGFAPAELENLMNEAALLAARRNDSAINMEDIEEASIKVQAGPAKKSRVITEKERKLTAVHEAGHAVVSKNLKNSDPVHMITIIPRGRAGGFTAYLPDDDRSFITKGYMEDMIVSLFGGRVAESLVLDDISTGASNDIERATHIARDMVMRYGFSSKMGAINYVSEGEEVFIGKELAKSKEYSDKTASRIDEEVELIINNAYERTTNILKDNMDRLIRISDALLEKETLNREEFERLYNGE